MLLSSTMVLLAFTALVASLPTTSAHLPLAFEPERIRQNDEHPTDSFAYGGPSEDFSFEEPFDIIEFLYDGLIPFPVGGSLEAQQRLPQTAFFVSSRLSNEEDVDYYMFDMSNPNLQGYKQSDDPRDHPANQYDFVAYVIIPACESLHDFFPSIAMIGPLNTVDMGGNGVFEVPSGSEPFFVPEGYGVLIKPGVEGQRTIYTEPRTGLQWLLPVGYPKECIEDYANETCVASPAVITVRGIPYMKDSAPEPFYFVVYDESGERSGKSRRGRSSKSHRRGSSKSRRGGSGKDFAFVLGTTDKLLASDWIRIGAILPFVDKGRTLRETCESIGDGTKMSSSSNE